MRHKKTGKAALALSALLLFGGCIRAASVQDVLQTRMTEQQELPEAAESGEDNTEEAETEAAETEAAESGETEPGSPGQTEIDLSVMSTVMSYVEITRILANPAEYLGGKIKLAGTYYALGQSAADRENYCSMYDGCCTYCDVRFVTQDPNLDPAGYIPENQWVIVTGTLGVIAEGPHPVYGLVNAKVTAVSR